MDFNPHDVGETEESPQVANVNVPVRAEASASPPKFILVSDKNEFERRKMNRGNIKEPFIFYFQLHKASTNPEDEDTEEACGEINESVTHLDETSNKNMECEKLQKKNDDCELTKVGTKRKIEANEDQTEEEECSQATTLKNAEKTIPLNRKTAIDFEEFDKIFNDWYATEFVNINQERDPKPSTSTQ